MGSIINMVRTYILTPLEREKVGEYLESPTRHMSVDLRRARFAFKNIDTDRMKDDIELIEKMRALVFKKGPKGQGYSQRMDFERRFGKR